jgi:uncharacterized membrane protein YheB (UPF0754 family)
MVLTKSITTNLLAGFFIILGLLLPTWRERLLPIGTYALSGAMTNWLAIHMLFEKVPGLYGSGVIETRFEEFKISIKELIMDEFFSENHVGSYLNSNVFIENISIELSPILNSIDYHHIYQTIVASMVNSQYGSMLKFFGGEKGLEKYKGPIIVKVKETITEIVLSPDFQNNILGQARNTGIEKQLIKKIDAIVTKRLDEIGPERVKEMMQRIISEHLGWLVVWGGVFGGIIGLVTGILSEL